MFLANICPANTCLANIRLADIPRDNPPLEIPGFTAVSAAAAAWHVAPDTLIPCCNLVRQVWLEKARAHGYSSKSGGHIHFCVESLINMRV
jgi:hypothetical protein